MLSFCDLWRKVRSRFRLQNGMPFPDRPSGGNYDPEFGSKTGYAIPMASQGGTHFPVEAWDGRRVPESGQSDGQVVERAGSEAPLLKIHLLNLATVGRIKSTAAQG